MFEFIFSLKKKLPNSIVIIGTDKDKRDETIGSVIFSPIKPNQTAKKMIIAIMNTNLILLKPFLTISIITS